MVIYLDLVMGLNFGVDFLLLLGTNRLAGFPPGYGRSAAAAALGAIYAGVCILPGFGFLGNGLWRIIFLGLVGIVAFGFHVSAWKRTGIFILLSLALGGMAVSWSHKGMLQLLLSAGGIWLLCRVGFGGSVGGREFIPITVRYGEGQASVIALKDTGNQLRDPVTGEQVLIFGPEAAGKLLMLTAEQLKRPMQTLAENPNAGLRLIPCSAVGNSGSMLLAKRFHSVRIGDRLTGALIAFTPERIGVGDVYQALAGGNTV